MSAPALGVTLVETPLGACALVWTGEALVGSILPGEASPQAVSERWPDARPGPEPRWVKALARRIAAHFAGAPDPFLDVPIDLGERSDFDRAVLEGAREIAPGTVETYGDLAARIGRPGAARAVGAALGKNPVPPIVPCHRVVARGGIGGFSSPGGLGTKRRLLAAEGVKSR